MTKKHPCPFRRLHLANADEPVYITASLGVGSFLGYEFLRRSGPQSPRDARASALTGSAFLWNKFGIDVTGGSGHVSGNGLSGAIHRPCRRLASHPTEDQRQHVYVYCQLAPIQAQHNLADQTQTKKPGPKTMPAHSLLNTGLKHPTKRQDRKMDESGTVFASWPASSGALATAPEDILTAPKKARARNLRGQRMDQTPAREQTHTARRLSGQPAATSL